MQPRLKKEFFIESVEIVFKKNIMTFDSAFSGQFLHYFAQTYKTIKIGYVEIKLYNEIESHFDIFTEEYLRKMKVVLDD